MKPRARLLADGLWRVQSSVPFCGSSVDVTAYAGTLVVAYAKWQMRAALVV